MTPLTFLKNYEEKINATYQYPYGLYGKNFFYVISFFGLWYREFRLKLTKAEFDFAEVMKRVQSLIKKIELHDNIERWTSLDIDCFTGAAQIFSPHEIDLDVKSSLNEKHHRYRSTSNHFPCFSTGSENKTKSNLVRHSRNWRQRKIKSNIIQKRLTSDETKMDASTVGLKLFFCLLVLCIISPLKVTYCAPIL